MGDGKPVFDTVEAPPVEVLEEYLLDEFSAMLNAEKKASILLACIGEKPGETAKFLDEERAERFEDFLEEAGLEFIETGSEFHQKYFFSMKKMFLGLLEDGEKGYTPRSVARFRGVPKSRIENPERMNQTFLESEVEIESEKKYLTQLSGIQPVSIEEKKQALELGERREEVIRQFDRKNSMELGEKLLEQLEKRFRG
ncbi:MAG: hypothetical protein ABEK10_00355 [Candidatus Nanosalina sp.]